MRKSFSKRFASKGFLLAAALMVSGCAANIPSEGFSPWGTYLRDDARANASPDEIALPLKKAWDRDISAFNLFKGYPKEQLSGAALSGGVLFVGSTDDRLYSIDMATGRTLWKFDAGSPIEAPPAVAGDRVCAGSSDGVMRCLDRQGKLLWQFTARSEILSAPVIRDGFVYFSSSDDRLYALDAATGEKAWTYARRVYKTVTPRIYASPAWHEGRLYHLFSDGTLVCLSAGDGREAWTKGVVKDFGSAAPARRTPLVKDGLVYTIDDNNSILALDAATGEVKGIYNIIKAGDFTIAGDDTLLLAGPDRVVALDMASGAIVWKKDLSHSPMQSVFAAGDYLFVLSNTTEPLLGINYFSRRRGYIEALRIADGSTAWERKFGSTISANGAAAQRAVALLPDDGELVLLVSP